LSLKRALKLKAGETAVLLGNEAIARGALEAGLYLAAAYPGTPSTEIVESLSEVAEDVGIYVEWSVNEKVAFEVAYGAAISGAFSLVAMKHVGLNVAADPLMSSAYTGVEGALVVVSADDPSMWSSQNEQDNRIYGVHAYIPVLEAGHPLELKDLTKFAFKFSHDVKHPVMLRSTTRLSHTRVPVKLGPLSEPVKGGTFRKAPERYVLVPANARELRKKLISKWGEIERYIESSDINRIEGEGDVLVIASGISYSYVKEAITYLPHETAKNIKILKISTPVPVPRSLLLKAAERASKILVVEELEPVVEMQVKAVLYDAGFRIPVHGKDLIGYPYEMSLERVLQAFSKMIGIDMPRPAIISVESLKKYVFPRPPQLCPGCPYRPVYYVLRKLANMIASKKGRDFEPVFSGDIGCYTLGVNPPYRAHDLTIEMGGSIGVANGLSKVDRNRLAIALIGDSTFYHAGIPPLINAVYNRSPMLVIVLDNGVTAMTGHQPDPGSGVTATGREAKRILIENIAKAVGVDFVEVVDPFDVKALETSLMRAIEWIEKRDEPALIVARRLCALEAVRRARSANFEPPLYRVNLDKCTGCTICYSAFACPAIRPISQKDRRAYIDPELCTGCGVCAKICPFHAIEPAKQFDQEVWNSFWRW